uniref:Uncharacterized protein n=1 Tax=Peronospora matthiolae TaxID=2874970 RepID=A0AAV1TAA3_9STRA
MQPIFLFALTAGVVFLVLVDLASGLDGLETLTSGADFDELTTVEDKRLLKGAHLHEKLSEERAFISGESIGTWWTQVTEWLRVKSEPIIAYIKQLMVKSNNVKDDATAIEAARAKNDIAANEAAHDKEDAAINDAAHAKDDATTNEAAHAKYDVATNEAAHAKEDAATNDADHAKDDAAANAAARAKDYASRATYEAARAYDDAARAQDVAALKAGRATEATATAIYEDARAVYEQAMVRNSRVETIDLSDKKNEPIMKRLKISLDEAKRSSRFREIADRVDESKMALEALEKEDGFLLWMLNLKWALRAKSPDVVVEKFLEDLGTHDVPLVQERAKQLKEAYATFLIYIKGVSRAIYPQ